MPHSKHEHEAEQHKAHEHHQGHKHHSHEENASLVKVLSTIADELKGIRTILEQLKSKGGIIHLGSVDISALPRV